MRKSQESLADIFGSHVFSDAVMRVRLPKNIYKQLRSAIDDGVELDSAAAEVVAAAMKDWAVERGATHFTHWFQPMNGSTAEKHDSFVSPNGAGGVILEFSGKELIKGEPDASSFPSGGLRATFEARGYTAWDCTSPAFIKEDQGGVIALCIPTAFCSYNGEALDKKTPLLRSMQALSKQAVRVLRALGDTSTRRVYPTVGAEQEYFLVDRSLWEKRLDLVHTGRTLVGAPPPKGQEFYDQYYGTIPPRASQFMADLDEELWKLGVPAKTQHRETAPAQYELASVFDTANTAVDHDQLTMEIMRKVADRHGLACIMHEKPFYGVNGSGKHNNWSLQTDAGVNLLQPGNNPEQNPRFLAFFAAVIAAVDEWSPLLNCAIAGAGNDLRLGEHEAPPTIISIYIGEILEQLMTHLDKQGSIGGQQALKMYLGVDSIPHLKRDNTDRNRTAPVAFTGNKFEIRLPGASMNVADVNMALNLIVADELGKLADRLEQSGDPMAALGNVLTSLLSGHARVLYNGNCYSKEWRDEAAKRGLPSYGSCVDMLKGWQSPRAVELFAKHGVLTQAEIDSRAAVMHETYYKTLRVEALTLRRMVRGQIEPTCIDRAGALARDAVALKAMGIDTSVVQENLKVLAGGIRQIHDAVEALESAMEMACSCATFEECARKAHEMVLPAMLAVRAASDSLETMMPDEIWPFPDYAKLLFSL